MEASKISSIIVTWMVCILTLQSAGGGGGCNILSSSNSSFNYHNKYESLLLDLNHQCPLFLTPTSPIQMDRESLERTLTSSSVNTLTLVLFYASWCPFSYEIQSKFGALAAMFPQIRHVMVEESSILPIVFSRYGIRSLPSILMVNQTGIVRYYGQKDLPSLLQFYKTTAGLDPLVDMTKVQLSHYEETGFQLWNQKPLKDIFIKEPYLILSLMFIFYKACIYLIPQLVGRVKALWFALVPHLSVGVLGESKQLLRRVFHVMDLKRIGNKVNTGSRSIGAQTARVWASSLASV